MVRKRTELRLIIPDDENAVRLRDMGLRSTLEPHQSVFSVRLKDFLQCRVPHLSVQSRVALRTGIQELMDFPAPDTVQADEKDEGMILPTKHQGREGRRRRRRENIVALADQDAGHEPLEVDP